MNRYFKILYDEQYRLVKSFSFDNDYLIMVCKCDNLNVIRPDDKDFIRSVLNKNVFYFNLNHSHKYHLVQ